MRRLPVYFLVDTSSSMAGQPITLIEGCLNECLNSLRQNPFAIESIKINVLTYGNNKIQILNRMVEVTENINLNFRCSGYSNINFGLQGIIDEYNTNFNKSTAIQKGDWKPMVVVFSGLAINNSIDRLLLDFIEKKFSLGFQDIIDAPINTTLNIQKNKYNQIIIVTSSNEYVIDSYNEYFTNIFNYNKKANFVTNFNNYFKFTS